MASGIYIGFDFGVKRFGVAKTNKLIGKASELPPIKAKDGIPDWQIMEKLVKEWQPEGFVVGLPLNMDGSESEMSLRATKFAKRMKGRFNLPVTLVDERLSSFEAKQRVKESTQRFTDFGEHSVDGAAACLILESWLAGEGHSL